MLQKLFVATATLFLFYTSSSQVASIAVAADSSKTETDVPKTPALKISGSVDLYYKYDFANTAANGFTSFTTQHNGFTPGMASVKLEHSGEKVSAVADLGFGPRAKEFAYTSDGITQAIKQLYVSYSPASWLKFTMGVWATHVGYELVDPQLNRNYSMSYMFTNGPFSHTGLKAEITKGKHGFMLGVANPTDFHIPPAGFVNKKFLLAQYTFAPTDKIKLYLNYVSGENPDTSQTRQVDAVVTAKFSDKFNIAVNGTVNSTRLWDGAKNISSQTWWGAAAYLNYDPASWFGLTLREELFSDEFQLKPFAYGADGGKILSSTLSANFKAGGFTFIPEFRLDHTAKPVLFTDKNGAYKNSTASFLVAAVYSFKYITT
ncbi:MAG: porin [Chitinophagaceae bacterium]|nr:porin [Chitinophagaceae bacterium]